MSDNYCQLYTEIWNSASNSFPDFPKFYTKSEKNQNEIVLSQFLKSIKSFRKRRKHGKKFSAADEAGFLRNTHEFLSSGLGFEDRQLEMMFSDELISASKQFFQQARNFDPNLSFSDIFQALRNVWIMNGLQLIFGLKLRISPSVFAYSLLYPYTDNYIDDPQISKFEKIQFSQRFRNRLSGVKLLPETQTEHNIFRLVGMIENEYSRTDFPEVFESLLAIHDAQTQSIRLVLEKNTISDSEILEICINKGGTSVLADGYLVAGKLSENEKKFLFGYGAYLQLLDDLQDVDEDCRSELKTAFSGDLGHIPLDEKVNKTYWFGADVMKSLDFFSGSHIDLFKSLMRRSMNLFIIEAIAQNESAFSLNYIRQLESWSPFHFSVILKQKSLLEPYHGILLAAIRELAFNQQIQDKKSVIQMNEA